MRSIEDIFRLSLANVIYYDGRAFVEVASGIGYANGINVDQSGTLLYLNALTELSTKVFQRDLVTGDLELVQTIGTETGVDNIEVDEKGNLWIATHPKLLDFVAHASDKDKLSPSQVLKVTYQEGRYEVEEKYLDLGEQISGSSVAAIHKDRMLVGSVFDAKFLDCSFSP